MTKYYALPWTEVDEDDSDEAFKKKARIVGNVWNKEQLDEVMKKHSLLGKCIKIL